MGQASIKKKIALTVKQPEKSQYRLTYIKEVNGINYKRLPLKMCEEFCKEGDWVIVEDEKSARKECWIDKRGDCHVKIKGPSFIPDNLDKMYKIVKNELMYDEKASNIYRKYATPSKDPYYNKSSKMRVVGGPFGEGELGLKRTRYKRLLERLAIRKANKAISSPAIELLPESEPKVSLEGVMVKMKRFIPKIIKLQPWQYYKNRLGEMIYSFTTYDVKYELKPA